MKINVCLNCGNPIKVTIFRGTGHCSDDCRKKIEKNRGIGTVGMRWGIRKKGEAELQNSPGAPALSREQWVDKMLNQTSPHTEYPKTDQGG